MQIYVKSDNDRPRKYPAIAQGHKKWSLFTKQIVEVAEESCSMEQDAMRKATKSVSRNIIHRGLKNTKSLDSF